MPDLLRDLRHEEVRGKLSPASWRYGLKLHALLAQRPWLYHALTALAIPLLHLFGRKRGLTLGRSILYCTLGYATHALLDTCTTYGTQLLWPFTDARFAWNTVSVVDPMFTLPVGILVAISVWKRRALFARCALAWAIACPDVAGGVYAVPTEW